ncbi:MAG: DoxX family membrane protein [Paraburkholderia sp.]|uniref:DoxX family membrane protein n=1 Tax=Paraburkholderia sp. TaxID=1926495 RepID=UPI001203315E|nr:DoxX family membrane protein [Paraburkholderia sp.]TAM03183.1 MAG: DoxX family membrane protein [Paraburkholderia sp.]TAM29111.1 MAG: DoxX family membrane protein [Paraburkholderia sp.]
MKTGAALALRLVLGAFWIWTGLTKVVGHFDAGPFLTAAISHSTVAPEAVRLILVGAIGHIGLPHIALVNVAVPWLELGAGLLILLGVGTVWGVVVTAAMSALFLMCGAISANPLLLFGTVLLAILHGHARIFTLRALYSPTA